MFLFFFSVNCFILHGRSSCAVILWKLVHYTSFYFTQASAFVGLCLFTHLDLCGGNVLMRRQRIRLLNPKERATCSKKAVPIQLLRNTKHWSSNLSSVSAADTYQCERTFLSWSPQLGLISTKKTLLHPVKVYKYTNNSRTTSTHLPLWFYTTGKWGPAWGRLSWVLPISPSNRPVTISHPSFRFLHWDASLGLPNCNKVGNRDYWHLTSTSCLCKRTLQSRGANVLHFLIHESLNMCGGGVPRALKRKG